MIGNRLRLARSAASLSLRELAKKIGNRVTAQAIGKYERNESMPSSGVLIALADALGVSVDYLVSDREIVLEAVEFRRKTGASRKEESRIEANVLHLLERYLMVEELLRLPSVEWNRPREAPYPVVRDVSEADRAARSLRDHWSLGSDPLPDLFELLEEQGIKVLAVESKEIDGLTARVRRAGKSPVPVIVVNRDDWLERQRFTLSHELGHLVMDAAPGLDEEKVAHRFAAAFLMPAEALWAKIGKRRTSVGLGELIGLKQLFGASVQAVTYRCKDLGIFNETLFRRLFNDFDRLGWRTPPYKEPHAKPGQTPKRFERIIFRALSEGAVSEAKAAELLGLSVHELDQRMDEPPVTKPEAVSVR